MAQWARRKDGAQLSLYAARVDAALKERGRLTHRRNAPEMGVAVKERKPPAQPTQAEASGCVHHFDIGNEHDGTSSGRCRRCGLRRVFRNEPSDAGASWGWRKGRPASAEEQESALNVAREEWSFDGESTTTELERIERVVSQIGAARSGMTGRGRVLSVDILAGSAVVQLYGRRGQTARLTNVGIMGISNAAEPITAAWRRCDSAIP